MKEPRGIRNDTPLNIRKGCAWAGMREVQTDPSFVQFKSMQYGLRAGFRLMKNHITGFNGKRPKFNTIAKLISVWAPPSENATNKYIDFVCQYAKMQPNDIILETNQKQMCAIARAMAFVENGIWIDEKIIESAWFLI